MRSVSSFINWDRWNWVNALSIVFGVLVVDRRWDDSPGHQKQRQHLWLLHDVRQRSELPNTQNTIRYVKGGIEMKKHSVITANRWRIISKPFECLAGTRSKASTSRTMIGVSKASVNHAVNQLDPRSGYVEQRTIWRFSLTESGRRLPSGCCGAYDAKRFLTETLGLEPEQADKEACGIEHHMSDETIERLERWIESCKKQANKKCPCRQARAF
jgi:Mn-dependent DtxR family transcriptional regulator